jgi:hypothetical protein
MFNLSGFHSALVLTLPHLSGVALTSAMLLNAEKGELLTLQRNFFLNV